MSNIRPGDATHRDKGGNLYKPGNDLNWLRWGNNEWFIHGTVQRGELTPLPSVETVELEKFDAPTAPSPCIPLPREQYSGVPAPTMAARGEVRSPHGVYKVQLTRWQAEDGSLHESYEGAVRHGLFEDVKALMREFMDHGEIEVAPFIASLLEHYKLERKP